MCKEVLLRAGRYDEIYCEKDIKMSIICIFLYCFYHNVEKPAAELHYGNI